MYLTIYTMHTIHIIYTMYTIYLIYIIYIWQIYNKYIIDIKYIYCIVNAVIKGTIKAQSAIYTVSTSKTYVRIWLKCSWALHGSIKAYIL